MESLDHIISDYLETVLRADPVAATQLGIHAWDSELGMFGPDVANDYLRDLRGFLARLERSNSSSLPFSSRLDSMVAIVDVKVKTRQHAETRFWERAPYWHLERLGTGASILMERQFTAVNERAESLLSRLEAVPEYLTALQRLIVPSDLPGLYVDMAMRVADGLQIFFGSSVPTFASQLEGRYQRSTFCFCTESRGLRGRFFEITICTTRRSERETFERAQSTMTFFCTRITVSISTMLSCLSGGVIKS